MSDVVFIDFESRSDVDLRKAGVEKYAESPHTSVSCLAWAFDDAPPIGCLADDIEIAAARLFAHVRAGGLVVAHNAPFELAIWNMMHKREPDVWPRLAIEQTQCTMAMCRAMSIPGALEQAAKALRLNVEKDMEGHKLMRLMCKPRKPKKGEPKDRLLWHETPEQMVRQLVYCIADIEPERQIYKLLPKLAPREQRLWQIDRRINDRGIALDIESVKACSVATDQAQDELAAELAALTGGHVASAKQVAKLLEWLAACGFPLPNTQRATIEAALERKDLTPRIRRALEIRQLASKSSTGKLAAMLNGACADSRARGLIEFHGASTGRYAGRRIQPQNMMRPPEEWDAPDAEDTFEWLKTPGGARIVKLQHGSVISAVAWSMRSLIVAAPGSRLLAADFANIEGRCLAWLAGEDWKLQAFRDFDAGTGPDLYKLAYSKSFNLPVDKITKPQRQIGKVQELALGYQGAHGAFVSMAKNYKIDLDDIAAGVRAAVAPAVFDDALALYWRGARESAEELLAQRRIEAEIDAENGEEPSGFEPDFFNLIAELAKANRYGLSPDVWAAVRIIVDGWRAAHPATTWFWKNLEQQSIAAVEQPGTVTQAGRIKYAMTGDFLMCRLPSGRKISYPYPRIEYETRRFKTDDGFREVRSPKLVFEGVDSKTRKWRVQRAYGGLLAENVTQATARCALTDAQHRCEDSGYPIVLHVHDENVSELPADVGTLDEFYRLMSECEPWLEGCPVAVDGWEGTRYRK